MFDAQQHAADLKLEPFPFRGMDGEIYELPNLKSLNINHADRVMAGDFFEVIDEAGVDAAAIAQIRTMPVGILEPLIKAWIAAAEVKPGESAASSPSTGNTARPSKQTSRSAAGSKTRKR